LGWFKVERYIIKNLLSIQEIKVLSGRKRLFPLNNNIKVQLYLRRFFEWTLFGEMIFTFVFIMLTPLFVIKDFISGKK